MDRDWKERERREKEECERRDQEWEKTLAKARQQRAAFNTILDEDAHAMRSWDNRDVYTQHGAGFDPCPIQEPTGPPGNYQAITGQPTPHPVQVLNHLERALDEAEDLFGRGAFTGHGGYGLVGGVRSPPRMLPSRRTVSEILQMSPPMTRAAPPAADDMYALTPPRGTAQALQSAVDLQAQKKSKKGKNIVINVNLPPEDHIPGYKEFNPMDAVHGGINAIQDAVHQGIDTARGVVYGGYNTAAGVVRGGIDTAAGVVRGGIDTAAGVVHGGIDTAEDVIHGGVRTVRGAVNQGIGLAGTLFDTSPKDVVDTGIGTIQNIYHRIPVIGGLGQHLHEDMELTPGVTRGAPLIGSPMAFGSPYASTPGMTRAASPSGSPGTEASPSEHHELLARVRRTVEEATRNLNMRPASAPHPLSYGFSQPPAPTRRQPLADLYTAPPPQACPSGPSPTRAPPTPPSVERDPIFDDPRLNYRSRLQSPGGGGGICPSPGRTPAATRSIPRPPRMTRSASPAGTPQRPMSPGRPTEAFVRAAVAAGTLKGTQEEMEAIGFSGDRSPREMLPEWEFAEQCIPSYDQPPPEIEEDENVTPPPSLLKDTDVNYQKGRQFRVMLKRKVVKVTIPPRPEPGQEGDPLYSAYKYEPGDPPYGVTQGELLPPRRLTPSPPNTCYQEGYPRTRQQMQSRRDLEADWERRQEAVPSREYPGDRRPMNKPLPRSFTTGKPKKHQYYRGGPGAQDTCPQPTPSTSFGMAMGGAGRPQTPTTRTGLVLRTPSTPTTTRSGSAPPPGRCPRGRPPARGGRGGRGRSASPAPTMSAFPYEDNINSLIGDASGTIEDLEARALEIPKKILNQIPDVIDSLHPMDYVHQGMDLLDRTIHDLPNPMDYVNEAIDRVQDESRNLGNPLVDVVQDQFSKIRQRVENLGNLVVDKVKELGDS